MSQDNPYAAPQSPQLGPVAPIPFQAWQQSPVNWIWRDGPALVMHKFALLPDVCVHCNHPAHGRRLKRELYWHHPALYLTLLIGVLVYVLLALILRQHATIQIGLCNECRAKRRLAMLTGWGLVLAAVAMLVGGVAAMDRAADMATLLVWLSPVVLSGGAIWGVLRARMVWPKRITDQYVWIKGVHPNYLDRFPVWPWPNY